MKVTKKEVKTCHLDEGKEVMVLELEYTHRRKKGRIWVRDYNEETYEYVLKQIKKEVTKAFTETGTLSN